MFLCYHVQHFKHQILNLSGFFKQRVIIDTVFFFQPIFSARSLFRSDPSTFFLNLLRDLRLCGRYRYIIFGILSAFILCKYCSHLFLVWSFKLTNCNNCCRISAFLNLSLRFFVAFVSPLCGAFFHLLLLYTTIGTVTVLYNFTNVFFLTLISLGYCRIWGTISIFESLYFLLTSNSSLYSRPETEFICVLYANIVNHCCKL